MSKPSLEERIATALTATDITSSDLAALIAEVETAKATDFVTAPAAGTLASIAAETGAVVPVGELLAVIETGG